LLILDGHGSHETITIIDLAAEYNIIVLLLPPHTTHKLQPLDVGIFGPFSRKWIDVCDDIVILTGSEMRKEDFVKQYMEVREETFRRSTIVAAFKKSGIWPVNRDVFTAEDYAPSIPYSTEARDMPDLPEFDPLVPIVPPSAATISHARKRARRCDSDSGSDSDSSSDSDSDSDSESGFDADDGPELPQQPPSSTSMPAAPTSSSASIPTPSPAPSLHASSSTSPSTRPSRHSTQSPLPPTHFYHDPVLFARIQRLENEVHTMRAHVGMVEFQLAEQKRKLNERDGRVSKRRKLNVEARVLTSAEGKRLAAEKDAERARKAQSKADGAQRRKEKENCRDETRRNWDHSAALTGLLSAKNKDDLMDIAWSLNLSEEGTKAQLLERMTKHFDTHPEQRDSAKYSGLFARAPRGRRTAATAAPLPNDTPQPSTSHIPSSSALQSLPLHPNGAPYHPNFGYSFPFPPPPIQAQHGSHPQNFRNPFAAPQIPYEMAFPAQSLQNLQPFDDPFSTYTDYENTY
jgi:hypothetical protein